MATAVALLLVAGAGKASALPALVERNINAITELEYKYFDPVRGDEAYPTCHRVCERLFKDLATPEAALEPFDRLDELYLLAARTGLTGNFDGQQFPLGASPVDALVQHSYASWVPRGVRYSGLEVPGVGSAAAFSWSSLSYPQTVVTSTWVNGTLTNLVTPATGWLGDQGENATCPGDSHTAPGGSPGPGWQLIKRYAENYSCPVWDPDTQQWDELPGTALMWAWWHPATFYGPSRLDPWKGVGSPHYMLTVQSDPGFAVARARILDRLDGPDYVELVEWLDHALGGTWSAPSARALDGAVNPAAPNLTHAFCGDPVNCATGNFTEDYEDTSVRGPGITLSQHRTYNSQQAAEAGAVPGPFGYGWSATFRASLSFPAGSDDVVVHHENGSQARFSEGYDGDYVGDEFVQSSLEKLSNGHYRYRLPTQIAYEFDGDGRLLSESDPFGNTTALTYAAGRVSAITDAVGRHLDYTYNNDGTVASVSEPGGHVVHYAYDDGELTSVTDVGGAVTQFAYGSDHQITAITDPRGHVVTRNTYDSDHRVVSQRDALDHETTWVYSADETTITDPSGSVTREEFEDLLPTKVVRAVGTASQATTRLSYDGADNLVEEVDGEGQRWKYDYDVRGDLRKATDPLGRSTLFRYDGAHHVTRSETPGGHVTTFSYGSHGELASRVDSATGVNRWYQYDSRGMVTKVGDSDGTPKRETEFQRDAHGNVVSTTSATGRTSTATYDANGYALTSTTPRGKTTTSTLDAYERPTAVVDARGKTTTYGYDAAGNPTSVTDRNGHTQTTVFDDLDRPTEIHRPDGSVWTTTYNASGQVATRVDGRGKTTSYTYDHQHRLHSKTDPLGRQTTFAYDKAGRLTSAVLPDGSTRAMIFDDAGQLDEVDYPGSSQDVAFTYDADGHRLSMTDAAGTASYGYDAAGRLTHQTSAAGQTTTYHYDTLSRVTSIDYPDALSIVSTGSAPQHVTTGTVTRTYDLDDKLTGVTDWLGHTTSFGYDDDGGLTSVTRPNGVDASFGYDDVGALSSITDDSPATSLTRDDERRLSGTDDGVNPATFSYDDVDRLITGLGRTYAYDNSDDLIKTATAAGAPVDQQFDDANELIGRTASGLPVATLTYDDNGQRTSMTPATGTASTWDWTSSGRLRSYTGPDLGGTTGGSVTETYTYDGDGLRQTVTTSGQRRHQAWDISGSMPLMITDGPTSYITGPGGLPIEQITAGGAVRYFSHDQLGSTTALIDESGATVQRYSYDAYGQLTSTTPTVENPFRFAGGYTDTTTGLQYFRARYYDAATGQFISRDPLEDVSGTPYAYADDDPANATDPSGMLPSWEDVAGVVSSVVPASVSDGAARVLDVLTGGAASDITCNGLNWENGLTGGAAIAMTFVPGGRLGEELAVAAKGEGALSRLGSRLADETGSFSNLSLSQLRAVRSLEKQAAEHEAKLAAYKADPDAFDNLGLLRNAPSEEIRQRIINGRVRHLENEISTFRRQIDEITGGG